MAIETEGIATGIAVAIETETEINVIGTEIAIGTEAEVTIKTPEATIKDRWSESGTTGTVAVVVKTMIG